MTRCCVVYDLCVLMNKNIELLCLKLVQVHYLSGPIRISDKDGIPAQPGDLLVVEICNLGPLPGDEWGFTATFDRENGGGFLTDHFPCATKAIWYFEGIYAYSPQIPGEFDLTLFPSYSQF